MVYEYICKESGEVIERDFPVSKEIPSKLEIDGKLFKRRWSLSGIHIPEGWAENQIRYDKSPSRKKHFW